MGGSFRNSSLIVVNSHLEIKALLTKIAMSNYIPNSTQLSLLAKMFMFLDMRNKVLSILPNASDLDKNLANHSK